MIFTSGRSASSAPRRSPSPSAADAALALDGDAELLERRDVAPDRAGIDREPVGDLAAGRDGLGLQELEQLEQPGGGRRHARKSTMNRGRDRPYLLASVPPWAKP